MQTIELPATEDGYYRFGDLPRAIAQARQPTGCPSDADGATLWWLHVIDAEKRFSKWLTDATMKHPGGTGYLHVVDSFNRLALDFRHGYALENGLVHIDSLNEWGASQAEPIAFAVIGKRQSDAPTNEIAKAPNWSLRKPQRMQGYAVPLYDLLRKAHAEGQPRPTARGVLERWRENVPPEIDKVLTDSLDYYDAKGNTKPASLDAIRKAIDRMTDSQRTDSGRLSR